jgi:hypothetical protein
LFHRDFLPPNVDFASPAPGFCACHTKTRGYTWRTEAGAASRWRSTCTWPVACDFTACKSICRQLLDRGAGAALSGRNAQSSLLTTGFDDLIPILIAYMICLFEKNRRKQKSRDKAPDAPKISLGQRLNESV